MADEQQILATIAEALTLPVADIDKHSSLQDDLGLNPVEIADLIDNVSKKYNIVFDPLEVEQVRTVSDLVELIEDKLLE